MELQLALVREILGRCSRGFAASQHILIQLREHLVPYFYGDEASATRCAGKFVTKTEGFREFS